MNRIDLDELSATLEIIRGLEKKKDASGLLKMASSGCGAARRRAFLALVALGPKAAPAVTKGIKGDIETRVVSARVLGALGKKTAVKPLTALLDDAEPIVQQQAALALAELADKGANKALEKIMNSESPAVSGAVLFAIGKTNGGSDAALLEKVTSKYALERIGALSLLSSRGSGFERETVVEQVAREPNRLARMYSIQILQQSNEFDAVIRGLASDSCPLVRRTAAQFMPLSDLESAATVLSDLLDRDPDPETRRAAVNRLAGSDSEAAKQAIGKALVDDDWAVREAAHHGAATNGRNKDDLLIRHMIRAEQWDQVALEGKKAIGPLLEVVEVPDRTARGVRGRLNALDLLGRVAGSSHVKPLIALLTDQDNRIRQAALDALSSVGSATAHDSAAEMLRDVAPEVRSSALLCLGTVGTADKTVSLVLSRRKDSATSVRLACVKALGLLGCVEELHQMTRVPESELRAAAYTALADIGDLEAIEFVIRGLYDAEHMVRRVAKDALYRLNWLPVGLASGTPETGYSRWMTRREWAPDDDQRSAFEILREGLGHDDPVYRRAAIEALGIAEDHEAAPLLEKCLGDESDACQLAAALALFQLGHEPATGTAWAAFHVHREAWDSAAALGVDAVPSLERVTIGHEAGAQRRFAVLALAKVGGKGAEEAIHNAMVDEDPLVRLAAAQSLVNCGAKSASHDILYMLGDSDISVRQGVHELLLNEAKAVGDEVVELLRTSSDLSRAQAASLLGHWTLKSSFDALGKGLIDPFPPVRAACAWALGQFRDKKCAELLIGLLADNDVGTRRAAAAALDAVHYKPDPEVLEAADHIYNDYWLSLDDIGEPAVPLLMHVLTDDAVDSTTNARRSNAIQALGRFKTKAAVPRLEQLATSMVQRTRLDAIEALGRIGSAGSAALLIESLAHFDPQTNVRAVAALGCINGKTADSGIVSALEHQEGRVRAEAALLAGVRSIESAVPMLIEMTRDDYEVAAQNASVALKKVGASALVAVSAAAGHADQRTRLAAVKTLGELPEGAAVLVDRLADDSPIIREQALLGLGRLGYNKAADAITKLVHQEHTDVRCAAIWALGQFKSVNPLAIQGALADSVRSVQAGAISALENLGMSVDDDLQALSQRVSAGRFETLDLTNDLDTAMVAHVLRTSRAGVQYKTQLMRMLHTNPQPLALAAIMWHLDHPRAEVRLVAAECLESSVATIAWDQLALAAQTKRGAVRGAAVASMCAIDPKRAQKIAIEALEYPDASTRARVLEGIGYLAPGIAVAALVEAMSAPSNDIRMAALRGAIRLAHPDVVPAIVERTLDSSGAIARQANKALRALGSKATSQLAPFVTSTDALLRRAVAASLSGGAKAIEVLLPLLSDGNPHVRNAALHTVTDVGSKAGKVKGLQGALLPLLWDPHAQVRRSAVEALAATELGTDALKGAISDPDPRVRKAAIAANGNLPPGDPWVVASEHIRMGNLDADELNGMDCRPLMAHVLMTHKNAGTLVRVSIAERFGKNGSEESILALSRAAADPTLAALRAMACQSLAALEAKEHVGVVANCLADSNVEVCCSALIALAALDPELAVEKCELALADPRDPVRVAAATALGKVGSKAAAELLFQAMSNQSDLALTEAARALGTMGATGLQYLRNALSSSASDVRLAAVQGIGEHSKGVPTLLSLLSDSDEKIRLEAASALAAPDDAACKQLIDVLSNDPVASVRAAAVRSLAQSKSKHAYAGIVAALADRGEEVTRCALDSLDADDPLRSIPGWVALGNWEALKNLKQGVLPALMHVARDQSAEAWRRAGALTAMVQLKYKGVLETLRESLMDRDEQVRNAAALGLSAFNDEGIVPQLVARFPSVSDSERAAIAHSLAVLGAVDAVDAVTDSSIDVRIAVAQATSAVALLRQLASDSDLSVSSAAGQRLGVLGEEDTLKALFDSEAEYCRAAAVTGLSYLKTYSKRFLEGFRDSSVVVRLETIESVCRLKLTDTTTDLLALLYDDIDDSVRLAAVNALPVVGAAATDKTVVSALELALTDQIGAIRRAADAAMEQLSIVPSEHAVAIGDAVVREHWHRLSDFGSNAVPACGRIMAEFGTDSISVGRRAGVMGALGQIGGKQARLLIEAGCRDVHTAVVSAAAEVIGKFDTSATIKLLTQLTERPEMTIRVAVCRACGDLRNGAAFALLADLQKDTAQEVRIAAAMAISGPENGILEQLVPMLADRDPDIRIQTCREIAKLGSKAGIDPLIDALGDANRRVRVEVERALKQLDWTLVGVFHESSDKGYSRWLTRTELLARYGNITDATKLLYEELTHVSAANRRAAAEALMRVDSVVDAEHIVPLLDDVDPNVRYQAYLTLKSLEKLPVTGAHLPLVLVASGNMAGAAKLGESAVSALGRALIEHDFKDRLNAAKALATIESVTAARALERGLSDEHGQIRTVAARGLGTLVAQSDSLVALLDDEIATVRTVAAKSLLKQGEDGVAALRDVCASGSARARVNALNALVPALLVDDLEMLAAQLIHKSADVRVAAAHALGCLGEAAVEVLANSLAKDTDDSVRESAALALGATGSETATASLVAALADSSLGVRASSLSSLSQLDWEPEGDESLVSMALAQQQWNVLAQIGKPAVPGLMRILEETDDDPLSNDRRVGALNALGRISDKSACSAICSVLKDRVSTVQAAALEALGNHTENLSTQTLKIVQNLVEHGVSVSVRRNAARLLGTAGDITAADILQHVANFDSSASVSMAAAGALAAPSIAVIKPLVDALKSTDPDIREQAAKGLGMSGVKEAIDPLLVALGDAVPSIRRTVRESLHQLHWVPIGLRVQASDVAYSRWLTRSELLERYGSGATLLNVLMGELNRTEAANRRSALEALAQVRVPVDSAPLIAALDDENHYVRSEAAETLAILGELPSEGKDGALAFVALGKMGQAAALGDDALQPLIRALREHNASERFSAANELQRFKDDSVAPALISGLTDETAEVRRVCAVGLLEFKAGAKPLAAALMDDSAAVRAAASHSLLAMGKVGHDLLLDGCTSQDPRAKLAAVEALLPVFETSHLDILKPLIDDPEPSVRSAVARAFGCIGEEALILLANMLTADSDDQVRGAAAAALGATGCSGAVDMLLPALHDPAAVVRTSALNSLAALDWSPEGDPVAAIAAFAQRDWSRLASLGSVSVPVLSRVILDQASDSESVINRSRALQTLVEIGGTGVSELVSAALSDPAGPVRAIAAKAAGQLGIHKLAKTLLERGLEDGNIRTRISALVALGLVGDKSMADALHRVAETDPSPNVRLAASEALAGPAIGDSVVLVQCLTSEDPDIRRDAALRLGELGVTDAIDPLMDALGDAVPRVRAAARRALRDLDWTPVGLKAGDDHSGYSRWITRSELIDVVGGKKENSQDALVRAGLKSEDPAVRRASLEAMAEKKDSRFKDEIIPLLDDVDRIVRRAAGEALVAMGAVPAKGHSAAATWTAMGDFAAAASLGTVAVQALCRVVYEHPAHERADAVRLLGTLKGDEAVKAINHALNDDEHYVRLNAVLALGTSGHVEAVSMLSAHLDEEHAPVLRAVVQSLAALGKEGLDALVVGLEHPIATTRAACVRGIGRLGPAGKSAKSEVEALLEDRDIRVRSGAAYALGAIQKDYKLLLKASRLDSSWRVRKEAIDALAQLAPKAAVDDILSCLGDSYGEVRRAAVKALTVIGYTPTGPEAQAAYALAQFDWATLIKLGGPAVPLLSGAVVEKGTGLDSQLNRVAALRCLAEIGDSRVGDVVLIALEDPSSKVRAQAAATAGRLEIKQAASRLVDLLLGDVDTYVRVQSATALGVLGVGKTAADIALAASQDPEPTVRSAAAMALAGPAIGDVERLIIQLGDADEECRRSAATELGRIKNPAALDPLIASLGDAASSVRAASRASLLEMGWIPFGIRRHPDSAGYERWVLRSELNPGSDTNPQVQVLSAAVGIGDSVLRSAVAEALGLTGDNAAVDPLNALTKDKNETVALMAKRALAQLQ